MQRLIVAAAAVLASDPPQSAIDGVVRTIQIRHEQGLAWQQSERARQQAESRRQADAIASLQRTLDRHQAQSVEVARIVAAGDCRGAERYALEAGNLVLAKQVKDYCTK